MSLRRQRVIDGRLPALAALVLVIGATGGTFAAPAPATAAVPLPATFNFSGSAQDYVVPDGVTQLHVRMRGGEGGDGDCTGCIDEYRETNVGGGLASIADWYITVVPGETLKVFVGGAGSDNGSGGWNGGGDGAEGGGGGGGASDVRRSPYGLDDRLIIAAGGGGGGAANTVGATFEISHGGAGGGSKGHDGATCFPYPLNGTYPNANGGGQATGGAGGLGGLDGTGAKGGSGAKGTGGNGAAADVVNFNPLDPWSGGGGGGGGGYYGGGGGGGSGGSAQEQTECGGGGAGGSDYPGFGPTNTSEHGDGAATLTPGIVMLLDSQVNAFEGGAVNVGITATGNGFTPKIEIVGGELPEGLELHDNGDGTAVISGSPAAGTAAEYEITVRASNPSVSTLDPLRSERKIKVVVVAAAAGQPTDTTIASSQNPSMAGASVDFTVSVAPHAGSGSPTGTVQLRDGGAPLGASVALVDGTAVITSPPLAAGTHQVSAIYSGDAVYNTSTSVAIAQVVNEESGGSGDEARPDARIRKSAVRRWSGNNVYNATGRQQTVDAKRRPRRLVVFRVSIQNEGSVSDSFSITGAGSDPDFRVRYFAGGVNVTDAVVAGTYVTRVLDHRQKAKLKVEVKVRRGTHRGDRLVRLLSVHSISNSMRVDAVRLRVTAK